MQGAPRCRALVPVFVVEEYLHPEPLSLCMHVRVLIDGEPFSSVWTVLILVILLQPSAPYVCRGLGFFIGVDLVKDPATREPNPELATTVYRR